VLKSRKGDFIEWFDHVIVGGSKYDHTKFSVLIFEAEGPLS